jgi:hypothetical protein
VRLNGCHQPEKQYDGNRRENTPFGDCRAVQRIGQNNHHYGVDGSMNREADEWFDCAIMVAAID